MSFDQQQAEQWRREDATKCKTMQQKTAEARTSTVTDDSATADSAVRHVPESPREDATKCNTLQPNAATGDPAVKSAVTRRERALPPDVARGLEEMGKRMQSCGCSLRWELSSRKLTTGARVESQSPLNKVPRCLEKVRRRASGMAAAKSFEVSREIPACRSRQCVARVGQATCGVRPDYKRSDGLAMRSVTTNRSTLAFRRLGYFCFSPTSMLSVTDFAPNMSTPG